MFTRRKWVKRKVRSLSHVWLFATPCTAAHQASCPSLSPRICSNSCPLSRWCHPTISSSVSPSNTYFLKKKCLKYKFQQWEFYDLDPILVETKGSFRDSSSCAPFGCRAETGAQQRRWGCAEWVSSVEMWVQVILRGSGSPPTRVQSEREAVAARKIGGMRTARH